MGSGFEHQFGAAGLDRNVRSDKRILVLLLLMMTPFDQFHDQRFDSSQTLLSTSPLATCCFLRASAQILRRTEITLASHFPGSSTRPEKFLIWLVPPARN